MGYKIKNILTLQTENELLTMTIKFYLKNGRKTIFLRVSIGKQKNDYSTGLKADVKYWDSKKQRIKDNAVFLDKVYINKFLNDLSSTLTAFEYELKAKHQEVTQDDIKVFLNENLHGKEEIDKDLITLKQYITDYVENAKHRQSIATGKPLTMGTIGKFKIFKEIFEDFCKAKKKEYDFDDIDIKFYDDFKEYLQNKKQYKVNTISKYIITLKTILNEATAEGINKNFAYKNARFKAQTEETTKIYLTLEELKKIETLDLNEKQDRVRKAFLLGCYTGLRYSDFSQLTIANIFESNYIRTIQRKTGGEVTIPLLPYVRNLIENNKLESIANVEDWEINREMKNICQQAGITEKIIKVYTKAGKRQQEIVEKWQEVGTHTARRSFATNMYLQGVPSVTIMKITGHKTETAFLRYLKITGKENADIMAEIISKRL